MCTVTVVCTSHTENDLSFPLIVKSLLLAMSFLLRKTWLVGWLVCFSVLYSYTKGEEELKKNLLRRKHTLRGGKASESSGAKSLPQQRKMHSSENVGGVGLPTHTG